MGLLFSGSSEVRFLIEARMDSLFSFSCGAFSSPTTCRFIPALSVLPTPRELSPNPSRLRKNLVLLLFLGGAAVYRCDKCFVLSPALAAEVTLFARKRIFQHPARAFLVPNAFRSPRSRLRASQENSLVRLAR